MRRHGLVRVLLSLVLVVGWTAVATAAVKLPAVIGDNMVLQRDQPVPIWGWADKGEEVKVSIAGQTASTKAGDDGRWKVVLNKLSVGQPLEMAIEGSSGSSVTLKNILVGEVWLCSGQSNMEMGVGAAKDGKAEIAAANNPKIRLFLVERAKAKKPADDVKGDWVECSPQTIGKGGWDGFSAVGYYFGRKLNDELNVPIGLIGSYWGGTPAEVWTSHNALESNPVLRRMAGKGSSSLYNGMIAPLIPYGIRGVIWYQGEANASQAYRYRTLFPAMIADWRAAWGEGDFPFLFVQLAPYRYKSSDGDRDPRNLAELWEAQLMTLRSVPNTGMAVTVDIGNVKDIHPRDKQDVGRRLAFWALAKVYGRDVVYSGPLYKSMSIEGNRIRLQFEHVDGGLVARDGKPLTEFTIAAADEKFVPAVAEIAGDSIVVHSDQVAMPVAVRYAWHDDATPNLANQAGLPASPFRTDTWRGVTEPK